MMPVSEEIIQTMFHYMSVAREIERVMEENNSWRKARSWWQEGEGQEAVGVGATVALADDDYIWYQGSGTSWAISQGVPPAPIIEDMLGKTRRACAGKAAAHCDVYPLAAGSAFASKLRQDYRVSLVNFVGRRAAQSTFLEALRHATAWKLPLIFLGESNGVVSESARGDLRPATNMSDIAAGHGIPCENVDGHDAVDVYEATRQAAERARAGEGPTFIEARLFRTGTTPDRRGSQGFQEYRDPVKVLAGNLSIEKVSSIREKAKDQVWLAYDNIQSAAEPEAALISEEFYYV